MKMTFAQDGAFQACYAAESWCTDNGYSVGSMERGSPRCLMKGEYLVAKWRNLTDGERMECNGVMRGDMRNGPVTIEIFDKETAAA